MLQKVLRWVFFIKLRNTAKAKTCESEEEVRVQRRVYTSAKWGVSCGRSGQNRGLEGHERSS
jgi:hypothetical protein